MGIIKRIVLHLISAGFLAAGVGATADPFFAQWCYAIAAGAFGLAWALPNTAKAAKAPKAEKAAKAK